jgi:hypothetical protein
MKTYRENKKDRTLRGQLIQVKNRYGMLRETIFMNEINISFPKRGDSYRIKDLYLQDCAVSFTGNNKIHAIILQSGSIIFG